jgi:hypothetical protein
MDVSRYFLISGRLANNRRRAFHNRGSQGNRVDEQSNAASGEVVALRTITGGCAAQRFFVSLRPDVSLVLLRVPTEPRK